MVQISGELSRSRSARVISMVLSSDVDMGVGVCVSGFGDIWVTALLLVVKVNAVTEDI